MIAIAASGGATENASPGAPKEDGNDGDIHSLDDLLVTWPKGIHQT